MNSSKVFLAGCLALLLFSSEDFASTNLPPPNLVNWWAGDGNILDSAGTNHGQFVGSVSYAPAVVSQGFSLDGTNGGYIDIGSLRTLEGAQGFTVMAWLNIRRFSTTEAGYIGAWDSAAATSMFLFSDAGPFFGHRGALNLVFSDGTAYTIYGTTTLPTNQWVHFAATWRSSDGAITLYKNGRLEQISSNGMGKILNFTTNYTAKIGEWGHVISPNHRLDGMIDEIQIFNRALTSNEITSVYSTAALPQVTSDAVTYTTYVGAELTMTATISGLTPVCFVWRKDGLDVQGWNCTTNGVATLTLSSVQTSDVGDYTLFLSNTVGSVESATATIQIPLTSDLIITSQPTNQMVAVGSNIVLSVGCSGPGPYYYQWRLNGVVIPGETNAVLAIANFQPFNSGEYTVVVYNDVTALISDPALLAASMPTLGMTDNFADQVILTNSCGSGWATNALATKESGEPAHAGKFGSHSLWISWSPPVGGTVEFTTRGSSFDTLLAVYTGDSVATLQPVTSDDDSGGFLTSTVLFNAQPGALYRIAVDGLGYASGNILLSWSLNPTAEVSPQITNQPPNQTAAPGEPVVLSIPVVGPDLSYRWFRDGSLLVTTTSNTLIIPSIDETSVGAYRVEITRGMLSVVSQLIRVDMNLTGTEKQDVRFVDKFMDMFAGVPLRLGSDSITQAAYLHAAGVLRGYSGAQVFSTYGSTSDPDEPIHCNVVGGASMWFSYYADQSGTMYLNTDGSTFDTILAVYKGPGTDYASLVKVACDNNSGTNGRTSALHFSAVRGTTYYIVVDGVNGATGTAHLNYSLVTPAQLASLGPNTNGAQRVRVTGHAGMRFTIQSTTNFTVWSSLLTTNSATVTFDYTDPGSITNPSRIYRALMLP